MNCDVVETVERQNAIIRIQSGVIDDLFLLLMQYLTAEEVDSLPVISKINSAARLRTDYGIEV